MPMEFDMMVFPYTVQASGPARALDPFVADPVAADGTLVLHYDLSGNPVADYRLTTRIEPMEHCGTCVPKFYLHLEARSQGGAFFPVTDLEPWLSSYGHAVVVGALGTTVEEKTIQHLHPVWPIASGDVSQDE
jgi:hypothetical protein